MEIFYIVLPLFMIFVLWLSSKILEKAGIDKRWAFCLLIPVVNIIMLWAFAFTHWPNLKDDVKQDINS